METLVQNNITTEQFKVLIGLLDISVMADCFQNYNTEEPVFNNHITLDKYGFNLSFGLEVITSYNNGTITIEDVAIESSEILDEALLGIIALRAPKQADCILETTEKELNKSIERATIDAATDGRTLSRRQQAEEVSKDFPIPLSVTSKVRVSAFDWFKLILILPFSFLGNAYLSDFTRSLCWSII